LTTVSTTYASGPLARARRWVGGFRRPETWAAYSFLVLWIFGFLVFTAGPMVASFFLSLTEYDILNSPLYVGLQNYRDLLDDPKIVTAMRNTLLFTALKVPLDLTVALILALTLQRIGRAAGFFRTVFYLPKMTPPVAVGIFFLLLFNGTVGIVNRGIEHLGLNGPFWVTDPTWVKPGLVIMSAWSVGGTMVIMLAALQSVPRHLYEASAIDGASAWRRFRDVTLPMISPALFFSLIVLTIAGLQSFDEAYTAFYGTQEGYSSDAALFYVIYLFQQGFQFLHMGYASAMAWLLFLVIMVITVIQVRVGNRFVYYEGRR
jgi:multiple sugar transport system permease protein